MRMRASLFAAPNLDCFASRNDGIKTRATFPVVIARLDRATQYSRDACDGIEKPRRTGYPAGACHRARRRRDPVAGYDSPAKASASRTSVRLPLRCILTKTTPTAALWLAATGASAPACASGWQSAAAEALVSSAAGS